MAKVEITCANPQCSKSFHRNESQTKYNLRTGRAKGSFCCIQCSKDARDKDQFTGFRELLRSCQRRVKIQPNTLTLQEMKSQWDKQQGICVYTKVQLILYHSRNNYKNSTLYRVSLDRIDNKKGYTADNVQFISIMANYAKNRGTHEQMIEFCRVVAENCKIV